jgi:uncharacterized protein YbbC (DUF1343 family)
MIRRAATLLLLLLGGSAPVATGLEVLVRDGFKPLLGKRVGLVVNHSAIDARRAHAVDLLAAGKGFTLAALLSPEHGLRGTQDAQVDSGRDEKTGLPVHSLYGKHRKPTAEMLRGLDTLVFDIQDIGTRYYTYITTLAFVMEAAKEHGLEVVVLDRPVVVGGDAVEGPVLEESLRGEFIGYFPLPTRHGMTVGELAGLYNDAFGIGCRLTVVRMEGWSRPMLFDRTGLPWVNPSPNMRSLDAALAYPGLGALEGTNLSVGRGTDAPFLRYGAPWIDSDALSADLAARGLPGVRFKPVRFTPRRVPGMPVYPFTDLDCGGFELEIVDRAAFRPVRSALHVLDALHRRHPAELKFGKCPAMIGLKSIEADLRAGKSPAEIERAWQPGLDRFLELRKRALLY